MGNNFCACLTKERHWKVILEIHRDFTHMADEDFEATGVLFGDGAVDRIQKWLEALKHSEELNSLFRRAGLQEGVIQQWKEVLPGARISTILHFQLRMRNIGHLYPSLSVQDGENLHCKRPQHPKRFHIKFRPKGRIFYAWSQSARVTTNTYLCF